MDFFSSVGQNAKDRLQHLICVGMSGTGRYQTIFGRDNSNKYSIMYSSDKGVTWLTSNFLSGFTFESIINKNFTDVCGNYAFSPEIICKNIIISGEGSLQLITLIMFIMKSHNTICKIYSYVLRSENYGKSWSLLESLPTDLFYTGCAMSVTGKYQTVCTLNTFTIDGVIHSNDTNKNGIYYSVDYGNSWSLSSGLSTISYISMCMIDDGSIQKAISTNGYIYTSNDFGKSWIPNNDCFMSDLDSTHQLFIMGVSGDTGQYQVIAQNSGNILVSRDYGNSWYSKLSTITDPSLSYDVVNVFVSNSGQYQFVKTSVCLFSSNDFGNTWTTKYLFYDGDTWSTKTVINLESKEDSTSMSLRKNLVDTKFFFISQDISYCLFKSDADVLNYSQITPPTINSTNIVTNISKIDLQYSHVSNNIRNVMCCIASSNGDKQMILGPSTISKVSESKLSTYQLQLSGMSGSTGSSGFLNLNCISTNSDCSVFVGCGQITNKDRSKVNMVLTSTDGITWSHIPESANNYRYSGIVLDNDGRNWTAISNVNVIFGVNLKQVLKIVSFDTLTTGYVKFTPIDTLSSPEILCGVCMSPDGTKQAIVTIYGSLFISMFPGKWDVYQNLQFSNSRTTVIPQNIKIAMNNSGKYISVCVEDIGIFVSSNSGRTFNISTVPVSSWKNIAISSSGQYQIAISSNSGMYLSTNYGQVWMSTNINTPYETFVDCAIGNSVTVVSDSNIYKVTI